MEGLDTELSYIKDIPFEYIRYGKNKDIRLSDNIKSQFDYYYREIKESNHQSIGKWTEMAEKLKSAVEIEVC